MNKVLSAHFALLVFVTCCFVSSCSKTTPVGSDLLEGDQANIQYTDTLTLRMATIKEDTVKTFEFNSNPDLRIVFDNYPFGSYTDPIFGEVSSSIYTQLRSNTAINDTFTNGTLDSIILSIAYDPSRFYGVTDEMQSISIHRITEDLDPETVYYSNDAFDYDPMPLATMDFIPNLDAVTIISSEGDTTVQDAQIRIPLSADLGNEMLSQSPAIMDSLFLDYFKGIHIRSTNLTNGMLNFDLGSGFSAIKLYFTIDTISNVFTFASNSPDLVKTVNLEQTFSPTVQSALNDFALGDSILFLQSLNGTNVQMEFPFADQLGDIIVNKAELEFTISVEDTVDFPGIEQLFIVEEDDDGQYLPILDLIFANNRGNIEIFGGRIEEDDDGFRKVYKMNITGAFQDMVDGVTDNPLFLRAFRKPTYSSRVTVFGPGHSQYPAKLNLIYTRLNE